MSDIKLPPKDTNGVYQLEAYPVSQPYYSHAGDIFGDGEAEYLKKFAEWQQGYDLHVHRQNQNLIRLLDQRIEELETEKWATFRQIEAVKEFLEKMAAATGVIWSVHAKQYLKLKIFS